MDEQREERDELAALARDADDERREQVEAAIHWRDRTPEDRAAIRESLGFTL